MYRGNGGTEKWSGVMWCILYMISLEIACERAEICLKGQSWTWNVMDITYGLFWALWVVCSFIFGAANLVVEMDIKHIKGMIDSLDLQLSTIINQWISSILLFHFELHYISVDKYTGPDRLSCWPLFAANPVEKDNIENSLDNSYSFGITFFNDQACPFAATPILFHTCYCLPFPLPAVDFVFLSLNSTPTPI